MGNKKAACTNLAVETKPQSDDSVIRVNFLDGKNRIIQSYDHDAMSMSQKFPNEKIITVYQNGIPTTMSVKQLIQETLLQVNVKLEA